jgi:hypothetical protein
MQSDKKLPTPRTALWNDARKGNFQFLLAIIHILAQHQVMEALIQVLLNPLAFGLSHLSIHLLVAQIRQPWQPLTENAQKQNWSIPSLDENRNSC